MAITRNTTPLLIAIGVIIGIASLPGLTPEIPWAIVAILIIIAGVRLRSKILIPIMAWVSVQNIVLPFLYTRMPHVSTNAWTGLLLVSEVTLTIFIALAVIPWRKNGASFKSDVWTYVLIYTVIAIVFSLMRKEGSSLFTYLNILRELLIPPLFFTAGFLFVRKEEGKLGTLLSAVIAISVLGAIGAIVDSFIPTTFWVNWGLGQYWLTVKHLPPAYVSQGLPLNMFELYGSTVVRRAISFYGDPLAAGYSMAIGFSALILTYVRQVDASNRVRGKLYLLGAILLLSGIVVTYTRAAIIMVVVMVVGVWIGHRGFRKSVPKVILIEAAIAIVASMYKVLKDTITGENSSVLVHLHSFSTFPTVLTHPMGLGITAPLAPEGLLFWMPWTIGMLPLVAFMTWMLFMVWRSITSRNWALIAFLISLLSTIFISIELLGDTSCGMGWILVGAMVSFEPWRSKTPALPSPVS